MTLPEPKRRSETSVESLTLARHRRYGKRMKEIIIKVDDELYDRAKQSVSDLESSVNEQVTNFLKALNGDDARIAAARSRMKELFDKTRGFGVGEKLSREEMHERRSVR